MKYVYHFKGRAYKLDTANVSEATKIIDRMNSEINDLEIELDQYYTDEKLYLDRKRDNYEVITNLIKNYKKEVEEIEKILSYEENGSRAIFAYRINSVPEIVDLTNAEMVKAAIKKLEDNKAELERARALIYGEESDIPPHLKHFRYLDYSNDIRTRDQQIEVLKGYLEKPAETPKRITFRVNDQLFVVDPASESDKAEARGILNEVINEIDAQIAKLNERAASNHALIKSLIALTNRRDEYLKVLTTLSGEEPERGEE